MAKNWLKKVSDILVDMDLDYNLKLRVATRLIDKSAAIWWDNLRLRATPRITWDMFV